MADSEKVQDQPQQQQPLKQKIQNHSDGINGESTPDSVIQPKQTIGELNFVVNTKEQRVSTACENSGIFF